jgi:hypothetical protein
MARLQNQTFTRRHLCFLCGAYVVSVLGVMLVGSSVSPIEKRLLISAGLALLPWGLLLDSISYPRSADMLTGVLMKRTLITSFGAGTAVEAITLTIVGSSLWAILLVMRLAGITGYVQLGAMIFLGGGLLWALPQILLLIWSHLERKPNGLQEPPSHSSSSPK